MKVSQSVILFFCVLIIVSCRGTQYSIKTTDEAIRSVLGNGDVRIENDAKSMVLAYKQEPNTPQNPRFRTEYLVIGIGSAKILYQGSLEGGYVKWLDEEHIEAYSVPGMIRPGQTKKDMIKVINVKSKSIMSKTLFEVTKDN